MPKLDRHKLGIIVPYRNREKQLETFVAETRRYLSSKQLNFDIIVVEQEDSGPFNRGLLLNVGFQKAVEQGCDYVVFHDVDMIPEIVDYSYSSFPVHLANRFVDEEGHYSSNTLDRYFGGVTMFPVEDFQAINGYANDYKGWGFEDDDLFRRCQEQGFKMSSKSYRQPIRHGVGLKFNGTNSYVNVPNFLNFSTPFSIYVNFRASSPILNKSDMREEMSIFSFPGLDTTLAYDSFGTYKFETFDNYEDVYSIHTRELPPFFGKAVIVVEPKKMIHYYQNGVEVGFVKIENGRKLKCIAKELLLGVGDYNRNKHNKWFRGLISEFAVFRRSLSYKEIQDLTQNAEYGLGQSFRRYVPDRLELYWDAKVTTESGKIIDLSGHGRDGEIHNCLLEPILPEVDWYDFAIPQRRQGLFRLQKHQDNGTESGSWRTWNTRVNQLKYEDRKVTGTQQRKDGLSNVDTLCTITDVRDARKYLTVVVRIKDSEKK